MRPSTPIRTLFSLLLLHFCLGVVAQQDPDWYYAELIGSDIYDNGAGGILVVEDDQFCGPNWNQIEETYSLQNRIVFEFDRSSKALLSGNPEVEIMLDIAYWDLDLEPTLCPGDPANANQSIELVIQLQEDPLETQHFRAVYLSDRRAHKMEVEVQSVLVNGNVPLTTSSYLKLYGELLIDRSYTYFCDSLSSIQLPIMADVATGEIPLYWTAVAGADEYDLEYTFYHVDSEVGQAIEQSSATTYPDFDWLFRHQATRITSRNTHFTIGSRFPEGYLLCRVRSARYAHGLRETGKWTSTAQTNIPLHQFNGLSEKIPRHEADLNWQGEITFAEEGKNVPRIQYFDGSMRQRQTVTKIHANPQKSLLVEEQLYDYHGRPALSIMTAPSDLPAMGYDPTFAQINSTNPYTKSDLYPSGSPEYCSQQASPMDEGSGAANYFSPSNSLSSTGKHAFVPDAEGFPFITTEYLPDLTNRPKRQGGVGPLYQIGQGKETQFLYGKPDQQELDRLFGNEVGPASHYLKNMILDPNGQLSVSYLDAHGRTIATALAGESPPQTTALDNNTPSSFSYQKNLLDNLPLEDRQLVSSQSFFIVEDGQPQFTYSMEPQTFSPTCASPTVCYDCVYNLAIRLQDNCQNAFNNGQPYEITLTNLSLQEWDSLCNAPNALLEHTFSQNLPIGEYKLTKTLEVNEEAMQTYLENFFSGPACLPHPDTIFAQVLDTMEIDCSIRTNDCLNSLDSTSIVDEYILAHLDVEAGQTLADASPGLVDTAKAVFARLVMDCQEIEGQETTCALFYQSILADLTPGGSYASYLFDGSGNLISDPQKPGIFDPGFPAYYGDCFARAAVPDSGYVDSVWIDQSGTFEWVWVGDLSVEDFILNWKAEWAEVLAPKHPEYSCYLDCFGQSACFDFDAYLLQIETFAEAVQAGLIDSVSCEPLVLDSDPCFDCHPNEPGYVLPLCLTDSLPVCIEWAINGQSYHETFSGATPVEVYQQITDWMNNLDPIGDWKLRKLFGTLTNGQTHGITGGADNQTYGTLQICGSNSCQCFYIFVEVDCVGSTSLANQLDNLNPSGCTPLGLTNLISNLVYCKGEMPCRAPFGKGCAADNDLAWQLYVYHYLALKKSTLATDNVCTYTANQLAGDPTFSNPGLFEAMQTELDQGQQEAEMAQQAACTNTCTANAAIWMEQITSNCGLSPSSTTFQTIQDQIISVCAQACVAGQALGATSTPNGQNSIKDILIAHLATDACGDCSPYQISFPGTYDQPQYLGAPRASDLEEAGDCACTNLSDLQSCWQNSNVPLFSDYLNTLSSIQLSEDEVQLLLSYCSNNGSCTTFEADIVIPPYLDCETCLDCLQFASAKDSFDIIANCSPTSTVYWDKLALFFNHELGLNLGKADYEAFSSLCAQTPDPLCERLCPNTTYGSIPFDSNCLEARIDQAASTAQLIYQDLLDSLTTAFKNQYLDACLQPLDEQLYADGADLRFYEYQYTLFYYDQAGNLVKTIPPEGVQLLADLATIESVETHRQDPSQPAVYPNHSLETKYIYNTLNQVVKQISPDHEEKEFWSDRIGRTVASQDGRQRGMNPPRYSYILYDALGRIIETGEKATNVPMTLALARNTIGFNNWVQADGNSSRTQITRTYYDDPVFTSNGVETALEQTNTRNRVASITIEEVDDGLEDTYTYGTHYAYDVSGNVQTLVQEFPMLPGNHRFKRLDYDYDYISGNVHAIFYQKGKPDQYTYRFEYDANNRLIRTRSSLIETDYANASLWETEATHDYYLHGPLARTELGEARVQGSDYAYTLQGWQKGMNSSIRDPQRDMGSDGSAGSNAFVGRDALAFTLGYFEGDYKQIGGSNIELGNTATLGNSTYHGHIRNMMLGIQGLSPIGYTYQYDQLYRLREAAHLDDQQLDLSTYQWNTTNPANLSSYSYNQNGNINTLSRFQLATGTPSDELSYTYTPGSNQLSSVFNTTTSQSQTFSYNGSGSVSQQAIGAEVHNISWTPYGRVQEVTEHNSTTPTATFGYGPQQYRVRKTTAQEDLFYVRDQTGNIMAVYALDGSNLLWKEQHIYASSRIGIHHLNLDIPDSGSPYYVQLNDTISLPEGNKSYELTNHLGNVMTVITDRKTPIDNDSNGIADYYEATLLQSNDYYPFGLTMSERIASIGSAYRMGFNGMEKDADGEFGGEDHYATYFRMYNPFLGRWLSIDPEAASFADQSPYSFSLNSPIFFSDPYGDCPTLIDCDRVKAPDGNTYSIPANSGTYNSEGQVTSFDYDGRTYVFNGEGFSSYSLLLERDLPYDATGESLDQGRYHFLRVNHQIRLVGDRPFLVYIGENGRVLSDDIGWGDFGSAQGVARASGRNWRKLLDQISLQAYGKQGLYGYGDPAAYVYEGAKFVGSNIVGGMALNYGLKVGRGIWTTSSSKGERLLWAGGKPAFDAAEKYARMTDRITLNQTPIGQAFGIVSKVLPWRYSEKIWTILSVNFVKHAKGDIPVVTRGIRPKAILIEERAQAIQQSTKLFHVPNPIFKID